MFRTHGGECTCSVSRQETIEDAEMESIVRYRAMRAMAEAVADAVAASRTSRAPHHRGVRGRTR
jgi:hypothetical protein